MVNEEIRVKEMLVIDDKGNKLGLLAKKQALIEASNRGLDLVLVSPEGNPPVAKLMDYSKYRFEQQKRAKEIKKNQKVTLVKEVQLSPTIEKHDFETKARNAMKFLAKGNKVKVTLRFYGRMIVHQEVGKKVVDDFAAFLSEVANVEVPAKLDGKQLFMVLAPKSEK